MPVQEIANEDTRPVVKTAIELAPDVNDFLSSYGSKKGSVSHCVNAIVRQYRDGLPEKLRGGQEAAVDPAQTTAKDAPKPKAAAA
jgi:hypothetical protein